MRKVSVREARAQIARLLEAVEAGEEVVITRRGEPVARLVGLSAESPREISFPSRTKLRGSLPPSKQSSNRLVRELREDRV